MKYKVLLTGNATSIIDDFFLKMQDNFDILTTSLRHEDILKHVKFFQPHILVYCMFNETRETFNKMISLKYQLVKSQVYFAIIGSQTDCSDFDRAAVNVSDLTLVKPITASEIESRLIDYLNNHRTADMLKEERAEREEAIAAAAATAAAANNPVVLAVPPTAASVKTRKHILVVDDDPRMLKMLKEQLHYDYDVAAAVSGKVAMKFLELNQPDVILLDYEMPEEKGPEVLEKIRANPNSKDVPVIFLTGVTEKEKIQKALVMQPQGYLLKPINHDRLMETIEKVLEG